MFIKGHAVKDFGGSVKKLSASAWTCSVTLGRDYMSASIVARRPVFVRDMVHLVDPAAAVARHLSDKSAGLTVFVNPYGRTPFRRIAAVLPQTGANQLRVCSEVVDRLLYWPIGEPFVVRCYSEPYRVENGEIVSEPRAFHVRERRAIDDAGRDAIVDFYGGRLVDHDAYESRAR